jgi:hypothetical protein
MGYRGSKSVFCEIKTVKEQRVDGSSEDWVKFILLYSFVRCTLAPKETWYLDKYLITINWFIIICAP